MRDRGVLHRAVQNMALIMRETLRQEKREWIRQATCISLSFDDRKAHKLVVFNCDMPLRHRRATQDPPFRHGIIGCLDVVHGESVESMEDDYAERTCKRQNMINIFATPLGDTEPEAAIVKKFRSCVKSIVVDGALQKVGVLLRTKFFRHVVLLGRDPAHMVRLACSGPSLRTGWFEDQHKRLFTSKRALMKDVLFFRTTSRHGWRRASERSQPRRGAKEEFATH